MLFDLLVLLLQVRNQVDVLNQQLAGNCPIVDAVAGSWLVG